MDVDREVIQDLLPLYFAGEASAATKSLVEGYLRSHPDFSAEVQRQAARVTELLQPPLVEPSLDLEKTTLERARNLQGYRSKLLGIALAFTLMPLAFVAGDEGLRWMMLRDDPRQAGMFFVCGLGFWIARFVVGRRLADA